VDHLTDDKTIFKSSETNAHGHRFTYCFFVTASFRLIPFYRIVWLVVIDLVVSRFRLWFIVALAPALFRWPWHLFHPIHLLLVTYVLYRGFPFLLSVVHMLGSYKGRDNVDSRVNSRAHSNDKRCYGDGVAALFHSTFSLYTFL
jgi:hypothetical protein